MVVVSLRDLDVKVLRAIRNLYLSDPLKHPYLFYDLVYKSELIDLHVNLAGEVVEGYVLVWRGGGETAVHVWGSVESLLEKLRLRGDETVIAYDERSLKLIKEELDRRNMVYGDPQIYLDMMVDEASFKPYLQPEARRITLEHEKLVRTMLRDHWGRDPGAELVRRIVRENRPYGVFVGDKLVSIAMTYLRLPEVWIVGGVYTRPEHRGRGYAKAVTSAVTRDAVVSGAIAMLHVREDNKPAIRVYRKLGYREAGKRFWLKLETRQTPRE